VPIKDRQYVTSILNIGNSQYSCGRSITADIYPRFDFPCEWGRGQGLRASCKCRAKQVQSKGPPTVCFRSFYQRLGYYSKGWTPLSTTLRRRKFTETRGPAYRSTSLRSIKDSNPRDTKKLYQGAATNHTNIHTMDR